ncbi:Sodium channel and clathrin linker 1 [Triplophysa tibetana]|uniref:Sodium channel and clathrin linker 1 n=1 Tax=Triplophysa tibetana TaxID=1572043 RepID=A0A5A9PL05_9TELE|nr:Sodium channel and clathrin linker 1 [Triplophysa tibetana]
MTTEVEFLRDQVNRLNSFLGRYQDEFPPPSSVSQAEDVVLESAAPWLSDRGLMAPLIEEYDRHIQQMELQLKFYQRQMTDVKASLEQVVKENERLHAEQRISIEKQLQSFSTGPEGGAAADTIVISNLEEQVKCAVEEKEQALKMWQVSAQELDRLQNGYQSTVSDGQIYAVERQHIQNQLAQVQQHAQKLQLTNQKLESEEDAAEAQGREETSDRRLQQMQTALTQLEARLKGATQDSESVRRKQTEWERQVGELQGRCSSLEEEKFEALSRLRSSIQLAEEASLHKEQLYKEGRVGEPELRKMEALHQRCLNAERLKDEAQLTLNSTMNKMKKMEMEYSEELSRCQEEMRRLQSALTSVRQESTSISEERVTLQQENQNLLRDMEALRKECSLAQRRAKIQVSSMQQELCVKEQGLESRLREMEESSKNSSAGLSRLLLAQQKTISRYKDEVKQHTEAFQQKLSSLRSELNRQKQRAQELEIQLEADHQKILEYERQVSEHQEKNTRLQRRLTQAEQRAASVSQQLSVMSQRRKAVSMMDLDSLS